MKNQSKFLGTKSSYLRQNWSARPFFGITLFVILALSMTACGGGAGPGTGPGTGSTPGDSKDNAIKLNEGVWADGNITAANREQWFTFTAGDTTNIHVNFGTLTNITIQLYGSDNEPVGVPFNLSASNRKYTPDNLEKDEVYYIKVTPSDPSASGKYQIALTESATTPANQLTENRWSDGYIPTYSEKQVFTFTATDTTQYIHINFGTLTDLYVEVFNSEGTSVGTKDNLDNSSLGKTSVSKTLIIGNEYSIEVTSFGAGNGTYQIMFNKSNTKPPITLPSDVILLSENKWGNGNIPASSSEQWFKFTASANPQYIHASFGTLTSLYVQLYDSGGNAVLTTGYFPTSSTPISASDANKYTSRPLTSGQVYYIKITLYSSSNSGTYHIAYTKTTTTPPVTLPSDVITLTEDRWSDGSIDPLKGEQWFKFTASAAEHYIHADFGTLTSLYVQVYGSDGNTVGTQTRLYSAAKYTSRDTFTASQDYYIKVTPSSSSVGTYLIAFNKSTAAPTTITVPTNAIQLEESVWSDGNITASSGAQWFTFTANAATQYIHARFDTLNSSNGLYVQVYDSEGNAVESQTRLFNTTRSTDRTLVAAKEYYIKVWPYTSSNTGTYQIGYNEMSILPANATNLTLNTWASGNIPVSTGEQWFKFTSTAATQFIHANFETLNNMYVDVYTSTGAVVGTQTRLYNTTKYASWTVTNTQDYYIKVTPYGTNNGTYQIGYNTLPASPSINIVTLTESVWADGNITSDGEQWFKFTASANPQYIHASFGTLNSNYGLYIQLYDSSGTTVGSQANLYGNSNSRYTFRPVTATQDYYIKVTPYNSSYIGTYRMLFNTLPIAPVPVTALTENNWTNGDIPTSTGEQWFKFTSTATTQYIHANVGTLTNLYVDVYTSTGTAVGTQSGLNGSTKYVSRTTFTVGQDYYIRVTPYGPSYSGTYQIAFNTMTIVANQATTLTVGTWIDGNIVQGGEKWFKFTATVTNFQYIHINFLTTTGRLNAQFYNSNGATVGGLYDIDSTGGNKFASANVTNSQVYYIKLTPAASFSGGAYKITLATSNTTPTP
jgi:hypothetical protein